MKRLEALFKHAPDAVIVIDEKGTILEWNLKARTIFGWKKEEVIGKLIHDVIIPPRLREAHIKGLEHYVQTGHGPAINKQIVVPGLRKDSSEFNAGLSISPFCFNEGKYFVGFIRDYTERKEWEDKIAELNKSLKRKIKELDSFTYSVSHDLRSPLRAILGYSKILKEDYFSNLDQEGLQALNSIKRNAKAMERLIDDLLKFSRLSNQEISKTPIDPNKLIEDIITQLGYKKDPCPFSIQPMPLLNADYTQIKQVFQNLISNALKFSANEEHPKITIGSKVTDKGKTYFVKDNGAGFDMRYYDKLFGIFNRLHRQDEFTGSGVGLAIVAQVIDRHGGEVWARGKVDEGATFYFSIGD